MGTPGQQSAALAALRHSAGLMRTKLTKSLALRVAPYIKFHIDEQLKKELDLLNVLQKVREENEQIDHHRRQENAPHQDDAATPDDEE
jgi:ribosome-binding factor A